MAGKRESIQWKSIRGAAIAMLFALAGALLLAPAAAHAATITVSTTADASSAQCTFRDAIAAANADTAMGACPAGSGPDVVNIAVTGSIQLASPLPDITSDMTLSGPGSSSLTVNRRTGGDYRIFNIPNTGTTVSISGLRVANGKVATTAVAPAAGGGIGNAGILTLDGVTVSGNVASATNSSGDATALGAGIYNSATGSVTLKNSTVAANTALSSAGGSGSTAFAGGAGIASFGTLSTDNSTLNDNAASAVGQGSASAGATGGAVYNGSPGTASVERTTVSGNSALAAPASLGGGIFQDSAGSLTVTAATLTGNQATASANFGASSGHSGSFRNTIFSGASTPAGSATTNCGGAPLVSSQGYNLEDANTCALTQPTDLINRNPQLGPLANNGGPTLTQALLPGSPAIDAGKSFGETTDQRGLPRPSDFPWIANAPGGDGADIGAFELQEGTGTADLSASKTRVKRMKRVLLTATVPCGGMPRAVEFFRGLHLLATRLVGTVKDPDCTAGVLVRIRKRSSFAAVALTVTPYPEEISSPVTVELSRR